MLHRKLVSIILCLVLCLSLSAPALAAVSTDMSSSVPGGTATVNKNFAAAPADLQEKILSDKNLAAAAKYAYMDIKTADEKSKDVILEARKTIIYSQSWTVVAGAARDLAGNIINVPTFSCLFPGWDVPTEKASEAALADAASKRVLTSTSATTSTFITWFNSSYYVPAAVIGQTAPLISGAGGYWYGTNQNYPEISFNGMDSGGRCNLGWSQLDFSSGYFVDVCYLTNQYAGNGCGCYVAVYGGYYAARVSTFDTPSTGYFRVGYYA